MIKMKEKRKSSAKGLKEILKVFRESTENPEIYLKIQEKRYNNIKSLVKKVYDYGQEQSDAAELSSVLPELIITDMDEEQIWQQLEIQNDDLLAKKLPTVSSLLSLNEKKIQLNLKAADDEDIEEENDEEEDEINDEEIEDKEDVEQELFKKPKSKKKAIVDDKFFNLEDMSKFLDEEDQKEMKKISGKPIKDSLMEIDYFSENESSDDEDKNLKYRAFFDGDGEDDEEMDEDGDNEEIYDDGENEEIDEEESDKEDIDETVDEKEESSDEEKHAENEDEVQANIRARMELWQQGEKAKDFKTPLKDHGYELKEFDDEAEPAAVPQIIKEDEKNIEYEKEDAEDQPKSSFELRQEKLQLKISKMEDQLLKDKPWQLKGEVSGTTRPQNSLLEEILEFDSTTRPAPVITEETTMKLEDIIKQRIKDKVFDDVERKIRPPDATNEFRKQLVLNSEKSKESLAQIYEKDYLKQLEKNNPDADDKEEEEPVKHKEIRKMMKQLMAKLDALSNYHYTPRPAIPEVKIITNTPAINIEEVAPVAVSDGALLAPEEVKNRPKGDLMSKEERTKTDKNRERRLKKQFQKGKQKRELEKERKREEKGISATDKQVKEKLLTKVTKSRNVEKLVETDRDAKSLKSSKAFFTQLQDEVTMQIKSKVKKPGKNKNNKNTITATHIKL